MKRRTLLGAVLGAALAQKAEPEVLRIQARKFNFQPAQLTLKRGTPVVLEFVTLDITMGFSAPGLGLNAAIPPGAPVRLAFTPAQTGQFEFLCDIFCGEGHEDMRGVIHVVA
jgi:cytochrome c oxidase subunit 2